MNLQNCLFVALGGAIGSLARFALASAMTPVSQSLPWSTILINVVGSFIIGLFGTLTLAHGRYAAPEGVRLFVMVGICGGFTTFSSFSLQTLDLIRGGSPARAIANMLISVFLCLLAVALGHALGSRLGGSTAVAQAAIEEA